MTAPEFPKSNVRPHAERIRSRLGELPPYDYEKVVQWYGDLHKEVQLLAISVLEPALNAQLTKMPHTTIEERRQLCSWVNAELRTRGFAIACPKSGYAAILHFDHGSHAPHGRFQVELTGPGTRQRTLTSRELPYLRLCEAPPRQEPLAGRWSEYISSTSSRKNKQRN